MKKHLILFALLLSAFEIHAQKIRWNGQPEKGLVYSITNREARKIFRSGMTTFVPDKMLHTCMDSFNTHIGWNNRPQAGHFVLVSVRQNHLHTEYVSCVPYQVFLMKEYNALSVQVLDCTGTVRTDARVRLGMNSISADTSTKTYRVNEPSFMGNEDILSVKLDGFTSYYNIIKHEVPPAWNYGDDSDRPRFYSYMITDKNKYKPGEKVRFKSFALNSMRIPIRKPLLIKLNSYPKTINLGTIKPHRPGSFTGDFTLADSLGLKLDKNYNLQLLHENGLIIAVCNFRYEDYELTGNRLEIDLPLKQFYPDTNILTITATDVNGLPLKDARAEIQVLAGDIMESFTPVSVLNDTLMNLHTALNPSAPSTIDISPGLFGKTNTHYEVRVTILTSENERTTLSKQADFFYSSYELVTRFSNDSLSFDLLKNDIPLQNVPVSIQQNCEAQAKQTVLPWKVRINPAVTFYHLNNQYIDKIIEPRLLSPNIELSGGIENDSFKVNLVNPQKLEVSWYIYKGTQLLEKGSGTEMKFSSFITDRFDNYYAELLYSLGGQDFSKRKQYEFRDSKLNVTLDIPEKIYPGKETDATIRVTDQQGEPVKDVDLTAIAVNRKLNYFLPELPYHGDVSDPRPQATSYFMQQPGKGNYDPFLNYAKWSSSFRLDTMLYYRFLYPDSSSIFTVDSPDSTQFQVFVMKLGFSQPIHVIEVDHVPVYFSWTNQTKQYSFYAAPGRKHQVTLRMREQVIILDSLRFEKGKKTILSLNMDHLPAGTKILPVNKEFSAVEISRYEPYISHFRTSPGKYAYLEFYNQFFPLYDINQGNRYITAGPVSGSRATYFEKNGPQINFRYEGGYNYQFEDNAVYKNTGCGHGNNLPKRLNSYLGPDPVSELNDWLYTKQSFVKSQQQSISHKKWISRKIDIHDVNSRLILSLPYDTTGITGVLFIDTKSGRITSPYFDLRSQTTPGIGVPRGLNSVVVLYETGNYLKQDSVVLSSNIQTVVSYGNSSYNLCDSSSLYWLTHYTWRNDSPSFFRSDPVRPRTEFTYRNTFNGNVQGMIYDEMNEPLPGVSIVIKGTDQGAITDMDGHFSLNIADNTATLQIGFIGYVTEEIHVTKGSEVIMRLKPDICQLQEVVVVGYGTVSGLSVTGAVSSFTGPADTPAEIIEDDNSSQNDQNESEQQLYNQLLNLNTIRKNFSDVAIWEPKLFTDKNGESAFRVKFPDDITRWEALVYAMNSRLQTGTARKSIRSFKPLMAELHTPQFLTVGDSSVFKGKTLNYTSDSAIEGKIKIKAGENDECKIISFGQFHTDLIPVTPTSSDSMKVSYTFTRNDGYFDAEERTIPVIIQGVDHQDGSLGILKNGDQQKVIASDGETRIVEITDNQLEIYKSEVLTLFNYRYSCNEQLASRLIALINLKYFNQFEQKKFRHEEEIRRIISRLLLNQNSEFLWSWWDISENSSYWISAHILRALKFAADAGYPVKLNVQNLSEKAGYKFEFLKDISSGDIDLLYALATWKAPLDYRKYIQAMDTLIKKEEAKYRNLYNGKGIGYSMLHEKFLLEKVRQMVIQGYKPDIFRYKKQGLLGEVFFSDDKPAYNWLNSDLETNLDAYRIIRNDSTYRELLVPMQQYFISARKNNWNTYESSNLLLTVLPDLLKDGYSKDRVAQVTVTGKENTTVSKFPYRAELKSGQELIIKKETGLPLYFMNYVVQHVTEARTGVEGLTINTFFENNISRLQAGKPVELHVEVEVKKDAPVEHVMIEVPIPAGCSYESKDQSYSSQETHREYFKEKAVIFCETLSSGKHTYTIHLLPRYTGSYFVNPAKVSLMYVPIVNANTDMRKAVIY